MQGFLTMMLRKGGKGFAVLSRQISVLTKIPLGTMDVGKKFASPPFKYLSRNFSFNQSGGLITKVFHFRKYLNLIFHQKWDENIKIRAAPIKLKLGVH